MNADHKNRLLLPVLLPLGILLAAALFIGTIAFSLLYNTHEGSLMLAAVVAGGILFTVSLASSNERMDAQRRTVVVFAAALPLLVGLGLATDLIPGVDEEARMINVEPLLVAPEDAPLIAAENAEEFCLPDDGGCEPLENWEVTPSGEVEELLFVFDNRDAGVPHNVVIAELDGDEAGEDLLESELVTGPVENVYSDEQLTWDDLPDEWYFFCRVHPVMNGTGTVVGGA